ncbi:MAG: DUF1566 domain-containing protein, partial [Candidatus Thiodiazotropha sp.]
MKAAWVGFIAIGLVSSSAAGAQFEPGARRPPGGGPPPEAFEACEQKQQESACSFRAPHGTVEGSCRNLREGMVCVPKDFRRGPAPGGPPAEGRYGPRESDFRRPVEPAVIQVRPPETSVDPVARGTAAVQNKVPDSGQIDCFNNRERMACGDLQQRFTGQDGHYSARQGYRDNGDGTVTDNVTGLRWQQAHNAQRLTYRDAAEACGRLGLAGNRTWRLPTITELFSISHWRNQGGRQFYIDRRFFDLEEPGPEVLADDPFRSTHNTSMMGQTWSSTEYSGEILLGSA